MSNLEDTTKESQSKESKSRKVWQGLRNEFNKNVVLVCIMLFLATLIVNLVWIGMAIVVGSSTDIYVEIIVSVFMYLLTLLAVFVFVHLFVHADLERFIKHARKWLNQQPKKNKFIFAYVTIFWLLYAGFKIFPSLEDVADFLTIVSLAVWPPIIWVFNAPDDR